MLRCIVFTTLAAFAASLANASVAQAAPSGTAAPADIPQAPSAPPVLVQKIPLDPFRCQRKFVYQGKAYDCDTQVRRDGENLRPILKDVPEAVAELDTYQRGRRNLRYTAYTATLGLATALVGYISNVATNEGRFRNGDLSLPFGSYLMLGGVLATSGSFVYGFSVYRTNESHLTEAVSLFNQARPNTPIALEFKTGIAF
jgi:hypothetical protein